MAWRQVLDLDHPDRHPAAHEYAAEMLSTTVSSVVFCRIVGGPQWAILAILSQAFLAWIRPRGSESPFVKIVRGFGTGIFWAGAVAIGKRLRIM
jgi:hypothetical protein